MSQWITTVQHPECTRIARMTATVNGFEMIKKMKQKLADRNSGDPRQVGHGKPQD
ncbi:hypothetical protein ACVITL_005796 [Rhizobium pisi]